MGTCSFGCGCSITISSLRIGDYEQPILNIGHCLKHTIDPIQQKLLARMASELSKLISTEQTTEKSESHEL